jgi:hypothetical protein
VAKYCFVPNPTPVCPYEIRLRTRHGASEQDRAGGKNERRPEAADRRAERAIPGEDGKGAYEEVEQLEKQLASERRALTGELEEKKEAIRQRR